MDLQYGQYGRIIRMNFVLQPNLPRLSSVAPASIISALPVVSSSLVIITAAMDSAQVSGIHSHCAQVRELEPGFTNSQNFFHAYPYTPDAFRAWIVARISQARAALAAENPFRSEGTLLRRRIFEMPDSSTEMI
ncbi:unnamed protein product [Diplocarpon coronariae]|nr:hypothetical protein JHW43_008005 [Diplocarpon mali]